MEERGSQAQKKHKILCKNFRNKKEKGILKRKSKQTYIYLHQTVFYLWGICYICAQTWKEFKVPLPIPRGMRKSSVKVKHEINSLVLGAVCPE